MQASSLKSAEGLAKIMRVNVNVFAAAGLTVSEKKTETMPLRTPNQTLLTSPHVIEAAGQRHKWTPQLLYLDGLVNETAGVMPEIKRRVRLAWKCFDRLKLELYDVETASFTAEGAHDKVRGDGDAAVWVCDAGSRSGALHCHSAHLKPLLRIIGFHRDNTPTTVCRMLRPSRRHNARASRRLSANGVSLLRGSFRGEHLRTNPAGDDRGDGRGGKPGTGSTRKDMGPTPCRQHCDI